MALSEAPPFWWRPRGALALALAPVAMIYGWEAGRRLRRPPKAAPPAPVICVGNFVAGGAGKTPTALALGRAARAAGFRPGFLSRGHGGRLTGPAVVDPRRHHAGDVGDEPLLLAAEATTVVSADRPAGAALLLAEGCDLVIMDDGFQNPSLAKDYALLVADGRRGLGNGMTIPAGPLRAPLDAQLRAASAVLVIGRGEGADRVIRTAARAGRRVFLAHVEPVEPERFAGRRVLAFAGIADPGKVFATLEESGAEIVERRAFGDHHAFTAEEAQDLLARAEALDATLVTTAKDAARLGHGAPAVRALGEAAETLAITLAFDDPRTPALILEGARRAFAARRLGAR